MAEQNNSKNYGIGCTVLIIIILTVLIVGPCSNKSNKETNISIISPTDTRPNLEVLNYKAIAENYSLYVVGTVKNNTSKEYSYVQIEINLYDKSGAQVGSTMDNTNNLEPGGIWKFKAIVLREDVSSFKIKDVVGY